jgi:FkbM family methyltransferase
MQKTFITFLNYISEQLDKTAHLGRHRFVKEKDVGIAYGEQTLRHLISFLSVDMVFDLGANIGQYGQLLRRKIGYQGPLISYEPIPQAAQKIRALARLDKLWEVNEFAVDSVPGKTQFHVMMGDQFSSLLKPTKQFEGRFHGQHKIQKTIEVDVITLGDAVKKAAPFNNGLLKLDTQGTELRILQGGVDSLPKFSAIQLEVGFQALYEGEASFGEIVNAMKSWGYGLSALFPNNQGHFPHLVEMDAIFLRNELFPELP